MTRRLMLLASLFVPVRGKTHPRTRSLTKEWTLVGITTGMLPVDTWTIVPDARGIGRLFSGPGC